MGIHEPTLAIAKKYVNDTLVGMGALKGAPCMAGTPYRDTQGGKTGTVVPMEWEDNEGADHVTPVFISDGEAGKISGVTATVDETTGTPIVEVSLGGTAENRTFAFAFSGIKGETGADGKDGIDGEDGRGISSIIIPDPEIAQIQVVYDDGTYSDLIDIPVVNGEDGFSPTITVNTNTPTVYKLDITDTNGTFTTPNLRGGGGGGGTLSDDLTASITVGGVSAGTSYEAGDLLEQVLRDMLAPALVPTLTNPSISLSVPGSLLLERGYGTTKTFTLALNRGSISPAYGTSGHRSGEFTGYIKPYASDTTPIPSDATSVTFDTFVGDNGNGLIVTEYDVDAFYDQGEQPKDSEGNNYDVPLPNGSVGSNVIRYEIVDALYANWLDDTSAYVVVKQPLISKSAKVKVFEFLRQTDVSPDIFDVPASWTITAVEVQNDLSGAWEDCSSEFDVTDTTHDDYLGVSVAYKRYTDNRGYNAGARKVRIKWS